MMIRFSKIATTVKFLVVTVAIGTVLVLVGCGGVDDIPEASVLSSGRVTLSWDKIPGAAAYDIYMATSPGVTTLNSYKISDVTAPITITHLEPGTIYYFMVVVYNDSGESRHSKEVSFTIDDDVEGFVEFGDLIRQTDSETESKPTAGTQISATADQPVVPQQTAPAAAAAKKSTPPAAKHPSQGVQRSLSGTREVTLAWDDVPGATSYNIYWSDKPGVTRRNGTKIANVENPYKLKGLVKGKKYFFVVTTVNQSSESRESGEFSFTVGE